jgi:branched-chain amino acid transport system permease protein
VFLFMVIYAPGGFASLVMMNLRVAAFGKLRRLWTAYLALGGAGGAALFAVAAMVEMVYHLQLNADSGLPLKFLGAVIDPHAPRSWFGALFALAVSAALFELVRRQFKREWDEAQAEIEVEIKRRETA